MKLVPTPPRGAKHVRTYGPLDGIVRIEEDAALVAACDRIPVVVQGKRFELYIERTLAEAEAEILVENDRSIRGARIEITRAGRDALEEDLETIPTTAEGDE